MDDIEFIQGQVSDETKRRFNHHPGYRGKAQRKFVGEIINQWLDSPAARVAILEERVATLERRLESMRK